MRYLRQAFSDTSETVRHHWQNHNEAALCVVRPIWDAEKGAHVYQRLNYKVTPETIPDASTLHVDDINWTITPPLPSGIGPTPQQRQPKLSDVPQHNKCHLMFRSNWIRQLDTNKMSKQISYAIHWLICHWRTAILFRNWSPFSLMLLLGNSMTGVKP